MEKPNHSQFELFSQTSNHYETRNSSQGWSFFKKIKKNEKAILILIGFLITGAISFALGVDKGKRIVLSQINHNLDLAGKREPAEDLRISASPGESQKKDRNIQALAKKEAVNKSLAIGNRPITIELRREGSTQGFTIQLASYHTRTFAQKEAETLKKKGLLPLVLSKSGFIVLCVGSFANKESAQPLLSQLKKQYPDCRIRRL